MGGQEAQDLLNVVAFMVTKTGKRELTISRAEFEQFADSYEGCVFKMQKTKSGDFIISFTNAAKPVPFGGLIVRDDDDTNTDVTTH